MTDDRTKLAEKPKTLAQIERDEAAPHLEKARETGRAVTFIGHDGCEVTCFPDGRVWFNVSDWY